jgi:hypothetical protein
MYCPPELEELILSRAPDVLAEMAVDILREA